MSSLVIFVWPVGSELVQIWLVTRFDPLLLILGRQQREAQLGSQHGRFVVYFW